jgi:hypothetical protein
MFHRRKLAGCSDLTERAHLGREISTRAMKFNLLQEQKQHAKRKARRTG